jgi:hypothetical protein
MAMYDNIYTHYYYEVACNSRTWADEDPARCGCRGRGWWSSEVDTWHQCPYHGQGVPHPEAEDEFYTESEEVEMAAPEIPMAPVEDDDLPF